MDYALKSIRATLAFDEVCLSAAIWRGDVKIGRFAECRDTGKPLLSFRSEEERAVFEEFIREWWKQADCRSLGPLHIRALIAQDADYEPPIDEKIRCWVKHLARPVERNLAWKWLSRSARDVLSSF